MVKILIFDTETTGLPPLLPGSTWDERQQLDASLLTLKGVEGLWTQLVDAWPHIIQLSYIFYDTEDPTNAKIFNKYIELPDNVVITKSSTDIHHITRETISNAPIENKATIQDVLTEFFDDVCKACVVVGHNVQFDRKMVVAELLRISSQYNLPQIQVMMDDSLFECTMIQTTQMCNLKIKQNYRDKITGEAKFFYKIKSPKLSEAYIHFFGYEPVGDALHNALFDVVVCLRIFCKYKYKFDIYDTNTILTNYIKQFTPNEYWLQGKK